MIIKLKYELVVLARSNCVTTRSTSDLAYSILSIRPTVMIEAQSAR